MEEVVFVVAVTHESMSALSRIIRTRIIHRTQLVEFHFKSFRPLIIIVIPHIQHVRIVISEISRYCIRHVFRICAAAFRAIHHIDRYSAMPLQKCYVIYFFFGAQRVQIIRHNIEVIECLTEVSGLLVVHISLIVAPVERYITMAAASCRRIAPIVHNLRHRRRDTTCVDVIAVTCGIFRT